MFFPDAFIIGYILKKITDERKNKANDLSQLKVLSSTSESKVRKAFDCSHGISSSSRQRLHSLRD